MAVLRKLWKTIGLLLVFLAIYQLPSALSRLNEDSESWDSLLDFVNQTTALWITVTLLTFYVLWIDVGPSLRNWVGNRRSPIRVLDHPHWQSIPIKDDTSETEIYINECYLLVTNRALDGATLKNLRVTIYSFTEKFESPLLNSEDTSTDLQHGQLAEFRIGYIALSKILGKPVRRNSNQLPEDELRAIKHNVPSGFHSFKLNDNHGLSFYPVPTKWPVYAVVSADDVGSREVELEISFEDPDCNIKISAI